MRLDDAAVLWGKDPFAAQDAIKEKLGDAKVQIAIIGPSGEKLVRISPVIHRIGNAAGQEGIMGGVVGGNGGNGGWGMSAHYDPRTFGYYWAVNFAMENRDPNRHAMTNLLEWTGLKFEQAMPVAKTIWGEEVAENGLSDLARKRDVPLTWNGDKSAKANATITRFVTYMGWDTETGLPRRATPEKLGMQDVAVAFEAKGFKLPA